MQHPHPEQIKLLISTLRHLVLAQTLQQKHQLSLQRFNITGRSTRRLLDLLNKDEVAIDAILHEAHCQAVGLGISPADNSRYGHKFVPCIDGGDPQPVFHPDPHSPQHVG